MRRLLVVRHQEAAAQQTVSGAETKRTLSRRPLRGERGISIAKCLQKHARVS